jgi:anti-sigma B factor antagonist
MQPLRALARLFPGRTTLPAAEISMTDMTATDMTAAESVLVQHPVPGQRVRIVGCVNASSVSEVRTGLHDAVDLGTGELLVELADLELGDATGLGALLGAHRRASRAGRTLVLTDVPATLQRILTYTRLRRVLAIREAASLPL